MTYADYHSHGVKPALLDTHQRIRGIWMCSIRIDHNPYGPHVKTLSGWSVHESVACQAAFSWSLIILCPQEVFVTCLLHQRQKKSIPQLFWDGIQYDHHLHTGATAEYFQQGTLPFAAYSTLSLRKSVVKHSGGAYCNGKGWYGASGICAGTKVDYFDRHDRHLQILKLRSSPPTATWPI